MASTRKLELPIKNQTLTLQNNDLQQWFARVEHSLQQQKTPIKDENIPEFSTRLLGRFGLKNADDVSRLLKSDAGKTIVFLVGEKLSKIESIKKYLSFQWIEEERKAADEAALLLLGLIAEREEKTQELNEEAEAIIEKIAHQPHTVPKHENAFVERQNTNNEIPPITVDILERTLTEALQESEIFIKEIEESFLVIEQELHKIHLKYEDFHLLVDNVTHAFNDTTTAVHAFDLDKLSPFLPALRPEKKLILENGKRYLLRQDQVFSDLNEKEKEDAGRLFESLQSQLQMVPALLRSNKENEEQKHLSAREALYERMDSLQNKLLLLSKQLVEIKTTVIETNLLSKAPTPKPMPAPPQETESLTRSYRMVLRLMEKHPTQKAIDWVRNRAEHFTGPNDSAQTMCALLNDLRAGIPVPRLLTDAMVKTEAGKEIEAPSRAPTPFSMRPPQ